MAINKKIKFLHGSSLSSDFTELGMREVLRQFIPNPNQAGGGSGTPPTGVGGNSFGGWDYNRITTILKSSTVVSAEAQVEAARMQAMGTIDAANLQAGATVESAGIQGSATVQAAQAQATATVDAARLSKEGQIQAAKESAYGQIESSRLQKEGQTYSADKQLEGQRYTADQQLKGTLGAAEIQSAAQMYSANMQMMGQVAGSNPFLKNWGDMYGKLVDPAANDKLSAHITLNMVLPALQEAQKEYEKNLRNEFKAKFEKEFDKSFNKKFEADFKAAEDVAVNKALEAELQRQYKEFSKTHPGKKLSKADIDLAKMVEVEAKAQAEFTTKNYASMHKTAFVEHMSKYIDTYKAGYQDYYDKNFSKFAEEYGNNIYNPALSLNFKELPGIKTPGLKIPDVLSFKSNELGFERQDNLKGKQSEFQLYYFEDQVNGKESFVAAKNDASMQGRKVWTEVVKGEKGKEIGYNYYFRNADGTLDPEKLTEQQKAKLYAKPAYVSAQKNEVFIRKDVAQQAYDIDTLSEGASFAQGLIAKNKSSHERREWVQIIGEAIQKMGGFMGSILKAVLLLFKGRSKGGGDEYKPSFAEAGEQPHRSPHIESPARSASNLSAGAAELKVALQDNNFKDDEKAKLNKLFKSEEGVMLALRELKDAAVSAGRQVDDQKISDLAAAISTNLGFTVSKSVTSSDENKKPTDVYADVGNQDVIRTITLNS